MRNGLLLLPVPPVAYCAYVLLRRPAAERNGTGFLVCSLSALSLVFFPVLLALFLPCVVLMEQSWKGLPLQ